MKYYLTIILTINVLTTVSGQSKDETDDFMKTFVLNYKAEGYRKAFTELFKTNSYMVPSLVDTISNGLAPYLRQLGEYQGAEMISKWDYGKCLTVHAYFLKYERQPIRFYFIFYKAKDKWVFLNVDYKIDFTDYITKKLDEELKLKVK